MVSYTVRAKVVDIHYDTPKKDDTFLVDTNVWFWLTYTKASTPALLPKISHYSSYFSKALNAESFLLYNALSLAELAHNIEKTERRIFSSTIKPKEYRHNHSAERTTVFNELEAAWSQVTSIAVCTDILVNEATAKAALQRYKTQLLDGYDLLILEAMDKAGVKQIITDDGDYVNVSGITVFTANNSAIAAATSQGKLLVR